MLKRWPALLFGALWLGACGDSDLNIPDRNSLGMSQPLIEIYSPVGDQPLPADTPFMLEYAVLRSADGHHIKIRIDDRRPQMVVKLEGKHRIQGLPAGKHRLQIIEYTKDGRKTGGNITLQLTMVNRTKAPETSTDTGAETGTEAGAETATGAQPK